MTPRQHLAIKLLNLSLKIAPELALALDKLANDKATTQLANLTAHHHLTQHQAQTAARAQRQ